MSGTDGSIDLPGPQFDFFRSGTGATLPDGTNDYTENVSHNGFVGAGISNPSTLTSTLQSGGSIAGAAVGVVGAGVAPGTVIPNATHVRITGGGHVQLPAGVPGRIYLLHNLGPVARINNSNIMVGGGSDTFFDLPPNSLSIWQQNEFGNWIGGLLESTSSTAGVANPTPAAPGPVIPNAKVIHVGNTGGNIALPALTGEGRELGRSFVIHNHQGASVTVNATGGALIYRSGDTVGGGAASYVIGPHSINVFHVNTFGNWLVGQLQNQFAATGVTDGAGNVTFNFPVNQFPVAPIVSGQMQTAVTDAVELRITALSATSVTFNARRSPAIILLGISVLQVPQPLVGATIHCIATMPGG